MLGVVLVSCLFVKAGFAGQQVIPELIRAVPAAGTKFATVNPSPDDQAIRQRDVVLDLDSLRELGKTLGAEPTTAQYVRVSFFSDATWLVELQRVEPTYSGGVAYLGRIPGVANSIAVLVDNDGVTSMQINALSQRFSITGSRESGYVVKELGEPLRRDHPREPTVVNAPPMPIATPMTGVSGDTIEIARDDGSTMDVMVVYTLAARTQNGSVAQINANIDAQIALTNTIYANSNVVQRLRLVYRGETNYTEVNMDTDLPRLRDGTDGFMDDVPVLRDIYKADFVSLWGAYSDYCGLGYLMGTESSGFAASAFNIVASPSCTAATHTRLRTNWVTTWDSGMIILSISPQIQP